MHAFYPMSAYLSETNKGGSQVAVYVYCGTSQILYGPRVNVVFFFFALLLCVDVPRIAVQAISMCARERLWQEAVFLLGDAKAAISRGGREADVVTYSAAVAACRNAGEWQQALSLTEV